MTICLVLPGDTRCPDQFACGDWNHPASCAASNLSANEWHFPGGIKAAAPAVPMMLFMSHAFNSPTVYSSSYPWQPATWPFWCMYSAPQPAASARFWHDIMAYHVEHSNLQAMTMDMLPGTMYAFASNLETADAAQELQAGYAAAAAEFKLPFRVDLHTPPLAMASMDQPAWVTSRCNGDATPQSSGGYRDSVAGASLLLASLNIRPMMDVLWTTPIQPGDPYNCGIPCKNALGPPSVRMNLMRDLVLAVLTAGPVGIGDVIGGTDVKLLTTALRADSVILKPAHPFLRLEKYYAQESQKEMLWVAASVPGTGASAVRFDIPLCSCFVSSLPFLCRTKCVPACRCRLWTAGPTLLRGWSASVTAAQTSTQCGGTRFLRRRSSLGQRSQQWTCSHSPRQSRRFWQAGD